MDQIPISGRSAEAWCADILLPAGVGQWIGGALINGEEPNGLSLAKLTQTFPEDWVEQRRQFGFVTD